jgi:hypothetical protein
MSIQYVCTLAAGWATRIWRVWRGKPCHCEHCEDRRRHAEEVAAYIDDERARGVPLAPVRLDNGKTLWTGDRDEIERSMLRAAGLPTLDDTRHRRYR